LPGRGAPLVVGLAAVLSLAMAVFASPVMRRCQLAASGFAYAPGEARAAWVDVVRSRWEADDEEPAPEPSTEPTGVSGSGDDERAPSGGRPSERDGPAPE